MRTRGLRRYHEQRRALPEARNSAEVRSCEGPPPKLRLQTHRGTYRAAHRGKAGRALALLLTCAIVFATVLAGGLLLERTL